MPTSGSSALFATNTVFIALATAAVALRFNERQRLASYLHADDYLILVALFFAGALVITNIVGGAIGGFGKSFDSLSDDEVVLFLKILFIEQFWYIMSVAIVKLSLLCLYGRIFPNQLNRWPKKVWIMIYLTIGWLISFFFATLFQVWPIWCNWTYCIPTTNYPVMYVCSSVFDILLDIMILCLPASFIFTKRRNMTRQRKVGVYSIFALGIFCIIASIARLAYTVILVEANVNANFASNFGGGVVNMIMWSGIEACASIVCASLPCYGTVVRDNTRIKSFVNSMRASLSRSSRGRGVSDSGIGSGIGSGNNMRLQRLSSQEKPIVSTEQHLPGTQTSIRGGVAADVGYGYGRESELERGGIKIDYSIGVHQEV